MAGGDQHIMLFTQCIGNFAAILIHLCLDIEGAQASSCQCCIFQETAN